jgi:hypothetical protein
MKNPKTPKSVPQAKLIARPADSVLPLRITDAHKAVLQDPRKVRLLTELVKTSPHWGTVWAEFDGLLWGFSVSNYTTHVCEFVEDEGRMEQEGKPREVDVWSFNTGYMDSRIITVCKEYTRYPSIA